MPGPFSSLYDWEEPEFFRADYTKPVTVKWHKVDPEPCPAIEAVMRECGRRAAQVTVLRLSMNPSSPRGGWGPAK